MQRSGEVNELRSVLFYIAGAATVGAFFTLWCAIAVQRVRKESEAIQVRRALCEDSETDR